MCTKKLTQIYLERRVANKMQYIYIYIHIYRELQIAYHCQ